MGDSHKASWNVNDLIKSVGGTGAGVSRAAIYDVIGMKLRQILYSNRFYKYFQVNIGQYDRMRPSALYFSH